MRAAGRSTIVTMAAVQRAGGVDVAAVGLTNMMNAGGAVLDFQLAPGSGSSGNGDSAGASATVKVLPCFPLVCCHNVFSLPADTCAWLWLL